MFSSSRLQQCANPCRKSGYRGKYDQQLQQLAFQIESVLSANQHTFSLRVIMLKEVESAKEKPVKENHVIGFVDREDDYKAQKELNE